MQLQQQPTNQWNLTAMAVWMNGENEQPAEEVRTVDVPFGAGCLRTVNALEAAGFTVLDWERLDEWTWRMTYAVAEAR